MDLTATDVENREFPEGRKGYVRQEVDRFLDEVAAQFRRYEERLAGMAARIATLESELAESRETEETARRMIVLAQRASEEAVNEAQEKARSMVEEAQQRAAALDEDTQRRRSALESDIETLRRFETEFRAELRQTLEGQLALLSRGGRATAEASRPAPEASPPAVVGSGPAVPLPATAPSSGPVRHGGPSPETTTAAAAMGMPERPSPPPVRVADNEVLRRLAEGSRQEPGQDR